MPFNLHPRDVLLEAQALAGPAFLPVCDHYSGTPERMQKSLQLQESMTAEFGVCVFDVTLDCEDGAPVGNEAAHARLVADLLGQTSAHSRVAVRLHAAGHPAFAGDVAAIVGSQAARLVHCMVPKVESVLDVDFALAAIDAATPAGCPPLPVHALIESPLAVSRAFAIAAHPRVQSLSFGLMDFVSSFGGAIPSSAMGSCGQFSHPQVVRAKLEIAAACHAHGKVPSHGVVREFTNPEALKVAARRASDELGYTRMWSIHPAQIRPIIEAFAPLPEALETATKIIAAAARIHWAPLTFDHQLHDRASFRYYWQLLERAHLCGQRLPEAAQRWFTGDGLAPHFLDNAR